MQGSNPQGEEDEAPERDPLHLMTRTKKLVCTEKWHSLPDEMNPIVPSMSVFNGMIQQ